MEFFVTKNFVMELSHDTRGWVMCLGVLHTFLNFKSKWKKNRKKRIADKLQEKQYKNKNITKLLTCKNRQVYAKTNMFLQYNQLRYIAVSHLTRKKLTSQHFGQQEAHTKII